MEEGGQEGVEGDKWIMMMLIRPFQGNDGNENRNIKNRKMS
jgi:hypothetical protein